MTSDLAVTPLAPSENPALVYLARLTSPASRRSMDYALRVLAGIVAPGVTPVDLPWHTLRYQHTAALRAALLQRYKARTVNLCLAALRGVLTEALNLRLVSESDAREALRVKGVRVDDLPSGRALEGAEVNRLLEACDNSFAGLRDRALVALLFGGGFRRAEVAGITIEAVNQRTWEIRVVGKGRKEREVPIPADAASHVATWLAARGPAPGPLLYAFDLRGEVQGGLTAPGIYSVLAAIAARAGVENLSPHDARRTRITSMLAAGESLPVVQGIVGHADVSTTARYDRSSAEARRAAALRVGIT